ncbi:MAG: 2-amino-4-hydroxy-6-hydroxymethyldihydropteridine diphosphokinase [Gammaproteobacteria bacterium]
MRNVALSLGSNINPYHHIGMALDALQARYGDLLTSSVFESEAVGFNGANFLNMVVLVETDDPLEVLVEFLKKFEDEAGRARNTPKFSGRTVDVDVLTYGDVCGEMQGITLPRPEIMENAYVLWPLSQVLYDEIHPGGTLSYGELWAQYEKSRQKIWSIDFKWQGRSISREGLKP